MKLLKDTAAYLGVFVTVGLIIAALLPPKEANTTTPPSTIDAQANSGNSTTPASAEQSSHRPSTEQGI